MLNKFSKILCCTLLSLAASGQAAEYDLHPSLAVSSEFTDNVFETSSNRVSDYIVRTLPGLTATYTSQALKTDLAYLFDYRHYVQKKRDDEITHSLTAKGALTVVENLLHLTVSEEYQRVSLDATRDVTRESLFLNQSDRNVVSVSPYITLRPSERTSLKAGYRFTDTRYFKSSAIDKVDHSAYTNLAYELSKRLSLTADYTFTRELADIDNLSQHRALGGFRYEYAATSFVFAQGGNSWTRYSKSRRLSSVVWDAGLSHVFDTRTVMLATGVRYNEDPLSDMIKESYVSGSLEQRLDKGSVSISPLYSNFVPTKSASQRTEKYGASLRGQYELGPDLSGTVVFSAEKYEQLGSYTRRFQVDSGLSCLLAKGLTASLTYIYVEYYSPGIVADNRHINRAMLQVSKIF